VKKILPWAAGIFLWLLGPVVFLIVEHAGGGSGFPLDDAWIHQTYARSLAQGGGWSYAGGPSSAGSTSPLWTFLQVPSFWLRIPPVVWASALGILLLLANAVLIMLWIRGIEPNAARFAFVFCVLEWHLVWAALSGMETILFCCWIALVLWLFFPWKVGRGVNQSSLSAVAALGLISGLGIWIRPEAVVLSVITLAAVTAQLRPFSLPKTAGFLIGTAAPILLYFAFEYQLGGHLLPNTFFVKTTEYSALTSASLILRFLSTWTPLLAGPFILLVLFVPAALIGILRDRRFLLALPLIWAVCHVGLYAVKLPAGYQHGRYFIPVLPVLIGYGVLGYVRLRNRMESVFVARVSSRAIWASAFLTAIAFLWIGAVQFSGDVAFIESGMVRPAQWIRDHTPADAVIAAHDIGALGFWGQRRIIDLGGVTDLGALPLLSGAVSLHDYLAQQSADLLMTIPDFYPGVLDLCIPLAEYPAGGSSAGGPSTRLYDPRSGCP
jgi:hypothetical protein